MSGGEVAAMFLHPRWPETYGQPVCPDSGCTVFHACPQPSGQLLWRRKACRRDVSITSGTYVRLARAAAAVPPAAPSPPCNEARGKSAPAPARHLDLPCKTAWVLAPTPREAMATEVEGCRPGGGGTTVGVDGACFAAHVKPANHKMSRRDGVDPLLPAEASGCGWGGYEAE